MKSHEPIIIGSNRGDTCDVCGLPLEPGHACSRMVEDVGENGQLTYFVQSVIVPSHWEPRKMVKITE